MGERDRRVPDLVEGALDQGRRAASGMVDGFRRAGRWQKARLGILGGWLGASFIALWIACPSSGPGNPIGADVHVLKDSLLGGQQILVRNESDEVWTDVVLTLDRTWQVEQRALRPREQVVLSPAQFERRGEPAPRDLRPKRLDVACQQGKAGFDLR
jgi:hypothetical protein